MKKSLLALAVLGAFASAAQAQTSVTIGGVLQANVKSYSVGNTTVRSTSTETRIDDDYTSRFWLTGAEDLGGGNSAIFYVENRLNTTDTSTGTGNGLSNGDTWLGLKGGWGQATIGKHSWMSTHGLTTEILTGTGGVTAMPTSMFATYTILNQAGGYLDITRRQNSIQYKTPAMGGFNATVGVATNSAANEGQWAAGTVTPASCVTAGGAVVTTAGALTAASCAAASPGATFTAATTTAASQAAGNTYYGDGREYYLQLGYANGPASASLAYRNYTVEGRTGTDAKQLRFSGFYKFGFGLKLGAQIDRSVTQAVTANVSAATDTTRTAWSIPISYGFGNHTILGSYTRANDLSTTANSGAKMYTLGWDYALSKRTNVGVYYSRLSNDTAGVYQPFLASTTLTGSGLLAGESASTFALGVKHTF